ncbi:MAG: hypothetical protein OQK82_09295 [Candidatus Pacearchaeota archaeon]|nr:hypothetical protein [Candidatus Pacearchaeota archaeon]
MDYNQFFNNILFISDDISLNYLFGNKESKRRNEEVVFDILEIINTLEKQINVDEKTLRIRKKNSFYVMKQCHYVAQEKLYRFLNNEEVYEFLNTVPPKRTFSNK